LPDIQVNVWNNEEAAVPPARRSVLLPYYLPDKVTMTFSLDFTSAGETHLDPVQAFRINKEIVEILDLPFDPQKLRFIKRENVEVTKYVKSGIDVSGKGFQNEIEVNYIQKGRSSLKRLNPGGKVGMFTVYLTVTMADVKEKIVERIVEKSTLGPTKFCMKCDYSMQADAKFCPNCGISPGSFSGDQTKPCMNCKETIPMRAAFCAKCGAQQPAQKT
jgi:RNA polymerase subunit RPABC4/transcription elongation factor Spt4